MDHLILSNVITFVVYLLIMVFVGLRVHAAIDRRQHRPIDWQHIADMEQDIYGYVSVWVQEHLPKGRFTDTYPNVWIGPPYRAPLTLPGVGVPAPRLPRKLADVPPYQPPAWHKEETERILHQMAEEYDLPVDVVRSMNRADLDHYAETCMHQIKILTTRPHTPPAFPTHRVMSDDTLSTIAHALGCREDQVIIEQKGGYPYARRKEESGR